MIRTTGRLVKWAAFLCIAGLAQAATPVEISFQGRLEDPPGTPMTGAVSLTLSIFDLEFTGTALTTETDVVALDEHGTFVTTLGDLPGQEIDPADYDQQLWVGIKVNGGAELAPRFPLKAAPYAIRAALADKVSPSVTIMTPAIQGGSLTNTSIAGGNITSAGTINATGTISGALVTATGVITGGSLSDGTTTLSGGSITGVGSIVPSGSHLDRVGSASILTEVSGDITVTTCTHRVTFGGSSLIRILGGASGDTLVLLFTNGGLIDDEQQNIDIVGANANFTVSAGDVFTFLKAGTTWFEVSRADN